MNRVAAIDLGTNTIRILVVKPNQAGYDTLYSDQRITRLGENLENSGFLDQKAMERTTKAIVEMLENTKKFAPTRLRIAATSAGRTAQNTAELAVMIQQATGYCLEVIPWIDEARLSMLGVQSHLDKAIGDFILFDIGGGSTEYISSTNGTVASSAGTNLGVVRLTEKYITKHPVDNDEYKAMQQEVETTVEQAFNKLGEKSYKSIRSLVGTAGTVTSLAAIDLGLVEYSAQLVNNHVLTSEIIDRMKNKLFAMELHERGKIPCLEGGREDLIVAGFAIIESTMKLAGLDRIYVSDYGLREGLIIDMLYK